MLVSQEEKLAWVTEHYWDRFLDPSAEYPCDSSLVNGVKKDEVEENFGMWVTLIEKMCPLPQGIKSAGILFDRAEAFDKARPGTNVFGFLTDMAAKYLYDPNSPVRDEDIYLAYVSRLAKSPSVPDSLRQSFVWQARLCSLNRRGSVAADFSFLEASGRKRTLHGVKSPYTLLIFSNPGCQECERMIEELSSPTVISMIGERKLAVVDIYIDEDIAHWKAHAGEYPGTWTVGYDSEMIIRRDLLYNVRAIPSMYLLDKDKKVLLKDAPSDRIIAALEEINNQ